MCAQTGALARGVDREQAEIGALARPLDVDAARGRSPVSGRGQEKFAGIEMLAYFVERDAVAIHKELLDAESEVDQVADGFGIARVGFAHGHG